MKTTVLIFGALAAALTFSAQSQADVYNPKVLNKITKMTSKTAPGFTALPIKKGGVGINLSYKIVGTPTAGQPVTIVVMASGAETGQVTMTADSGLVMQDPSQVLSVEAGKLSQHSVVVTPQADGRYYLNLFSKVGDSSSASAVAIQVGNSPANLKSSAGTTQTMPDGQRVKTIKVQ
jgi:hypothetical protein